MNQEPLPAQCPVDANVSRLLADMAHATAWIAFTAAQANHDLQRYGEWRCDYGHQASIFQAYYEKAVRELAGLLPDNAKTAGLGGWRISDGHSANCERRDWPMRVGHGAAALGMATWFC